MKRFLFKWKKKISLKQLFYYSQMYYLRILYISVYLHKFTSLHPGHYLINHVIMIMYHSSNIANQATPNALFNDFLMISMSAF